MENRTDKYGLTLIEMLIVVGIIAILTSLVIGIARRIDNQSKERLAQNTIAIITSALTQFRDYGYEYSDPNYRDFAFPIDCNGFDAGQTLTTLSDAFDATVVMNPDDPNINFSGSEVLYLLLSRIPESRATLEKIDRSLVKPNGSITIAGEICPLIRIIDPWKTTLRYDYYNEELPLLDSIKIGRMKDSKRTFPVIISAGPDKIFGTMDDITSK